MVEEQINDILFAFRLDPADFQIASFGEGHVHDTYLLRNIKHASMSYILQRMNHFVFKDIPMLMKNLDLITGHLAKKNKEAGFDPSKRGIVFQSTLDGKSWTGNSNIGYWRLFNFIEGQVSHETAASEKIAYEGGKAIAHFQSMLSDFDPEQIRDSIPRFHDLRMRLDQYHESLKKASQERIQDAEEMIKICDEHLAENLQLIDRSVNSKMPLRLTHNDTKFNNILFSKEGEASCLIDLDTVMKGFTWYDFGDALRTCATAVAEDEKDPSKVDFNMDIYKAFAMGFLQEAKLFLNEGEIESLGKAPLYFTYMQGLRFLTDYLNNDVYYKTKYPEHNLVRTRVQFTLMLQIKSKIGDMHAIIDDAIISGDE